MITFEFVDGYISPVLSTGDVIEVDGSFQLILVAHASIATLEMSITNVGQITVH